MEQDWVNHRNEEQVSLIVDNDDILKASSDSDEAQSCSDPFEIFNRNGMVNMGGANLMKRDLVKAFVGGMKAYAKDTEIVAIHGNHFDGLTKKARLDGFNIFAQAVTIKCGGNPNIRSAWYPASKEGICQIISHGFSRCSETEADCVSHGVGVYLYPTMSILDGVESLVADENGLKYILFCRVIMGKMEVIPSGSNQIWPSSTEFDCGVDNLLVPKRYIVWSASMNSHILPLGVISFRAPSINGLNRNQVSAVRTTVSQRGTAALFSKLWRSFGPEKKALLLKCLDYFKKNKITRMQVRQRVRQIVGDHGWLLIQIANRNREKARLSKLFI